MSHWDRIAAATAERTRRGRGLLAETCRDCGAPTLVGHADGLFNVWVDPEPLDVTGEALAILTARWTFLLYREGSAWVIDLRMGDDIATDPPGSHKGADVLARHECWSGPLPRGPSAWPAYVVPDPFAAWRDEPAPF